VAQVHMDSLEKSLHRDAIPSAFAILPAKLDDIYANAILQFRCQDREDAKITRKVMTWVTYAT